MIQIVELGNTVRYVHVKMSSTFMVYWILFTVQSIIYLTEYCARFDCSAQPGPEAQVMDF